MCYSGLITHKLKILLFGMNSGISRIPPIPPQTGIAVGFDFVGNFIDEWKTIGVGIVLSRDKIW
jgi:hypothetical protein